MSVNVAAAVQFVEANGRLLDRRRMQHLFQGGPADRVLESLLPFANDDGGFGSALEPEVRGSQSEPTCALAALEALAEIERLEHPATASLAAWVDTVADDDGGVPFVVADTALHPHGPWMIPSSGGSHLTFGIAGILYGRDLPWVRRGTEWCWLQLESSQALDAYSLKFALAFLDAIPEGGSDGARADTAVEKLSPLIGEDGTVPVSGGTEGEALSLLDVAPRNEGRSRRLFSPEQVSAGLDDLEATQLDDGGWNFDWLAWSIGQAADWRGRVTLQALLTLRDHHRLP